MVLLWFQRRLTSRCPYRTCTSTGIPPCVGSVWQMEFQPSPTSGTSTLRFSTLRCCQPPHVTGFVWPITFWRSRTSSRPMPGCTSVRPAMRMERGWVPLSSGCSVRLAYLLEPLKGLFILVGLLLTFLFFWPSIISVNAQLAVIMSKTSIFVGVIAVVDEVWSNSMVTMWTYVLLLEILDSEVLLILIIWLSFFAWVGCASE